MSTLSITRSLVVGTNPTEDQFDTIRDELLAFFNADNLDHTNLEDASLLYTSLGDAPDDDPLTWNEDDATIEFVSATPAFNIINTEGDVVFTNKASTTEVESLRLDTDGDLVIGTGGLFQTNQNVGDDTVTTSWLLSRYRKPRLEYVDNNTITIENNSPNSAETILLLRDRLVTVVDRTLDFDANANGETSGDTGAAASGIVEGGTRADDTWYFIYGVEVQYGDDNAGDHAILVASTTSPVQANCSSLDTLFGAGKWVYLGVVRNGYNDGVSDGIIIPFIYDQYGYLRFTDGATNQGNGILFASSNSDADLTYTVALGTGDTDIPVVASRAIFTTYRDEYGHETDYERISDGENHLTVSNCTHLSGDDHTVGTLILEVPVIVGYKVRLNVGTSTTSNKIRLSGVFDHYV